MSSKTTSSDIFELSDVHIEFKPPKVWQTPRGATIHHQPFKKFLRTDLKHIFDAQGITDPDLASREIVAQVFPFKINQHIIDQIHWNNYQKDPLFQLTFPQKDMLFPDEISELLALKTANAPRDIMAQKVSEIRNRKNPAPANQSANRPFIDHDNEPEFIDGLQHKYKKIVLMFHKNAQTCHAYCTYCFRFNQFVGKDKFLEDDHVRLHRYLKSHKEVSDVLMTGGDPATMKTDVWKKVLLPLLSPEYDHVQTIRMGTKALTYHPYRFLTDPDADDLIALFRKMRDHGKHISIMGHFSHFQEMGPVTLEAIRRLREEAGAAIRTQSPVMKHINDNAYVWAKMWDLQVQNGMIPYYMFVARDTGAREYFEIPLAQALKIYQGARKQVSGLGHTARGPSMSSGPGKICVLGRETVAGEDVFALKFLQGRNEDWCDRVFFAKYSDTAAWIDQLEPAFGDKKFFFEDEYADILNQKQKKYDEMIKKGAL
jgi:KamA family protein